MRWLCISHFSRLVLACRPEIPSERSTTMKRFGMSAFVHIAFFVLALGCHNQGAQGVGQPCDVGADAGASQGVFNSASTQCPSGLCLKPVLDPYKTELSPATGPTCSGECSSDSDCDGELRDSTNPTDTRCESGFACAVPFAVGPLCCKHLCVCKDFLSTAGATMPTACANANGTCDSALSGVPVANIPTVGQQTDIYISVAPVRKLDLVFMIDNSPSMAPKVAKMNAQFPKLIAALKDPSEGYYPDLRVAILDSDLGTGGAYSSDACGPNVSNGQSAYGDLGNFQMRGAAGCGMTNANALWIEYTRGSPVNYDPKQDISQVFGCLATNLGTGGCGEEHSLQAFEFGLVVQNVHTNDSAQQNSFLRPDAYLGLVFLSDEDDSSAATNDGMFGDKPELRGESASLRCATRGHQCSGASLSEVTPPGYPTTSRFETDFASCSARTDSCPNVTDGNTLTDTSGPTSCSPLKSVKKLADEIKGLKGDQSADRILVAGIFGWPRNGADGKPDFANAKYKIDFVPNPNTSDADHPVIYDYWPVCYDPNHMPKTSGGYDPDASGWGATGGLRMSAFVDEFAENGLKYSICEPDFTDAMKGIGDSIAKKLQNLCVDAKLLDVDPSTPGLQPDCRVAYRVPTVDPQTNKVIYQESDRLPLCPPGATPDTTTTDCWQLSYDASRCPRTGQVISIVRTAAEISQGQLPPGTKVGMQCWACPDSVSAPGCDY